MEVQRWGSLLPCLRERLYSKRVFRITLENLELIRACGPFWGPMYLSALELTVFCFFFGENRACDVNKDNSTDRFLSETVRPSTFLPINFRLLCSGQQWFWWVRRIRVRLRRVRLKDGWHFQGRQQARKLPNRQLSEVVTKNIRLGRLCLPASKWIGYKSPYEKLLEGKIWCQQPR